MRPRPWDNYIMGKFGKTIRDKVKEATIGSVINGKVVVAKEELFQKQKESKCFLS